MTVPASARPAADTDVKRLEREEAEAIAIYRCLFPDDELDFTFWQGQDPVWGKPSIINDRMTFQPHHLNSEYLGHVKLSANYVGARIRSINLSVPRLPFPAETANTEAPWQPIRRLRALFRIWPMAYEHLRYQVEMRRKRLRKRRHNHLPLSRSNGSPAFTSPAMACRATDRRPSILIGFHWLEVGGAEKLAFDCVNWALTAGLRVIVVASVPSLQRLADRLPDHPDIQFIRLDRYLAHDLWPQYIERLAHVENIRLIHIHHCAPLYNALAHLRISTPWIKVVDSIHVVENADGGYPRISGVWTNYIDHHHVISRELVDYYRNNFYIMHNIHLGRMLERIEEITLPDLNMSAGQKHLHVAFIGRMHYQKRPVVLVETLRALSRWAKRNGIKLTATIVGEGAFADTVSMLLKRYNLTQQVAQEPANSDIPALLRKSDILLLPSNNEGLALVCYEAIQHGCIPISTNVGAQAELIPPELLLSLEPFSAVKSSVSVVDNLWREKEFLVRQQAELHERFRKIAADPTAEEVLMPIYRAAAESQS